MMIGNAVAERMQELCQAHGITLNRLATKSQVTQSTLNSIVSGLSRNPTVGTIQKICDGLGISIVEFFDAPLFCGLEQEVR